MEPGIQYYVIVPLITFPKSGMPTENSEIYKCK
jgi:hypothetical protein